MADPSGRFHVKKLPSAVALACDTGADCSNRQSYLTDGCTGFKKFLLIRLSLLLDSMFIEIKKASAASKKNWQLLGDGVADAVDKRAGDVAGARIV